MTDAKVFQGLSPWGRMVAGFIAGFLATLVFHQLTLVLLRAVYPTPLPPFSMNPTAPFGIPVVFSLAFGEVSGASSTSSCTSVFRGAAATG